MSVFYNEAVFNCEITDHGIGAASTGTPQAVIQFLVVSEVGSDGETYEVEKQYKRTYYKSLTANTLEYFFKDIRNLGLTELTKISQLDKTKPGSLDLTGREIRMYCQHKADNKGGQREEWSPAFEGAGELTLKPVDDKALRNLDNLFAAQLKQAGVKPAASARPAAAPAPATRAASRSGVAMEPPPYREVTDDDVRF